MWGAPGCRAPSKAGRGWAGILASDLEKRGVELPASAIGAPVGCSELVGWLASVGGRQRRWVDFLAGELENCGVELARGSCRRGSCGCLEVFRVGRRARASLKTGGGVGPKSWHSNLKSVGSRSWGGGALSTRIMRGGRGLFEVGLGSRRRPAEALADILALELEKRGVELARDGCRRRPCGVFGVGRTAGFRRRWAEALGRHPGPRS